MDYTKSNCPFCLENMQREIIAQNENSFAFFDIYPVTRGHALVVCKRHIESFFETSMEEKISIFQLIEQVKALIDKKYSPDFHGDYQGHYGYQRKGGFKIARGNVIASKRAFYRQCKLSKDDWRAIEYLHWLKRYV